MCHSYNKSFARFREPGSQVLLHGSVPRFGDCQGPGTRELSARNRALKDTSAQLNNILNS